MNDITLTLYTNHNLNFDIFTQKVDISKSFYITDPDWSPDFKPAYEYLYSLLPKNETYIWCSIKPLVIDYSNKEAYRLHELDVPIKDIIFLDSFTWDCVINNWFYHTEEMYNQFENMYGSDTAYHKLIEYLTKKYKEPKNSWEDKLIIKNKIEKYDNKYEYLIPSPVDKKYLENSFIIKPEKK